MGRNNAIAPEVAEATFHPCPNCGKPVRDEITKGGMPVKYCRNGGECREEAKAKRQAKVWALGKQALDGDRKS